MPTLVLRLCGPMQSWGTDSRFDSRDSGSEPSKSGVLGLLCAALGIDRSDWLQLQPMCQWKMGVRVNEPGELRIDYQTAQLKPGNAKTDTVQSRRQYLADADFYVGFESEDREALAAAWDALKDPHWTLCLGRKAFPPSHSIWLENGLQDKELRQALIDVDPIESEGALTLSLETEERQYGERWDQPIAAFSERRFGPRRVKPETVVIGGSRVSESPEP